MKRITVKDIAEKSGYSVSTVSKTLNGTDRVGPEAIEKIKRIAQELGYRSSLSAQSLVRGTRKIGIVLFRDPVEVRQLFEQGFAQAFDIYGEFSIDPVYYLFDRITEVPWQQVLEECEAIIVTPANGFDQCLQEITHQEKQIPLAVLQTKPSVEQFPHLCEVTVNARIVGSMAAQYLGLCSGGGETAIVTGYADGWIHQENIRGFLEAAPEYHLQNVAVEQSFDQMDIAYKKTLDLLHRYGNLRSIFVTSYVSPAVCRAIASSGRSIRVVGVDLFKSSTDCLREGTLDAVIFQNQQRQAQLAVEAVVNSFRGMPSENHLLVKPELVLKSNLSCYIQFEQSVKNTRGHNERIST